MRTAPSEADTCVCAPAQPAHPRAPAARAPSRSWRHDYQRQRKRGAKSADGLPADSRPRPHLGEPSFCSFLTLTPRCETATVFAVSANSLHTSEEHTRLDPHRDVDGLTAPCP